jgi:hypothetical protein
MVAILRSSAGKSDVARAAQWGQNLARSGTDPPQLGHGATAMSLIDSGVEVHARQTGFCFRPRFAHRIEANARSAPVRNDLAVRSTVAADVGFPGVGRYGSKL